MARLEMQQAPAPATPLRFLRWASGWGMLAGALLAFDGEAALASRWAAPTLALVHALTLGFLGNAMFGALLQFLPVAAGVRVRGGRVGAGFLHALLNAGTLLLVAGFRWPALALLPWAAALLAAAFALLAGLLLPGLWGATGQRFLRGGIALALLSALVTASLGTLLVLGLRGQLRLPISALTDAHAGWGLLGWVLGLLAAVARVVMPMFQGARVAPARWQGLWSVALHLLLWLALLLLACPAAASGLRIGAGVGGLLFALGGLWLQLGAEKLRRVPLTGFWMAGLVALAAAACALLAGGDAGLLLVGVLALGIGLPLLVTGMQLEITAFLGWIDLQRRCGRGLRLPGVQLLLPERDKRIVLALHGVSAVLLLAALAQPALAAVAGLVLLLAHAAGLWALHGVGRRAAGFIRTTGR